MKVIGYEGYRGTSWPSHPQPPDVQKPKIGLSASGKAKIKYF